MIGGQCPPFINCRFSGYETVAKVLGGEGERSLGEHQVRPYGGRGHGTPCPYGTGWKPALPISCRGDHKVRPYEKYSFDREMVLP